MMHYIRSRLSRGIEAQQVAFVLAFRVAQKELGWALVGSAALRHTPLRTQPHRTEHLFLKPSLSHLGSQVKPSISLGCHLGCH